MYSERQHYGYVKRRGNAMRELRQLQIEFVARGEICEAQAASGSAVEFKAIDGVSSEEMTAAMEVGQSYLGWLTGGAQAEQADRRPATTAFLQTE